MGAVSHPHFRNSTSHYQAEVPPQNVSPPYLAPEHTFVRVEDSKRKGESILSKNSV